MREGGKLPWGDSQPPKPMPGHLNTVAPATVYWLPSTCHPRRRLHSLAALHATKCHSLDPLVCIDLLPLLFEGQLPLRQE